MSNQPLLKVIFLDIDGVLNNPTSGYGGFICGDQEEYYKEQIKWDQGCVNRLQLLVRYSGAVIVISSTWREDFSIADFWKFFQLYGDHVSGVIDMTDVLYESPSSPHDSHAFPAPRSFEIQKWLRENRHRVESFIILDDTSGKDFYGVDGVGSELHQSLVPHHIVTDDNVGLTQDDVNCALELLMVPCNLDSI